MCSRISIYDHRSRYSKKLLGGYAVDRHVQHQTRKNELGQDHHHMVMIVLPLILLVCAARCTSSSSLSSSSRTSTKPPSFSNGGTHNTPSSSNQFQLLLILSTTIPESPPSERNRSNMRLIIEETLDAVSINSTAESFVRTRRRLISYTIQLLPLSQRLKLLTQDNTKSFLLRFFDSSFRFASRYLDLVALRRRFAALL